MTKMPCVHPGDVRFMKSVKPSDRWYESLVNMIVFSGKGDRPDMEKMAGADLDGDVFWVCWDK